MKKRAFEQSQTVSELEAMEFTMDATQSSSINLKFLRMLLKLQLPKNTRKAED